MAKPPIPKPPIERKPQKAAAKQNRKIDKQLAEDMAALMAKQITETGAALLLGVKPEIWFSWKSRNAVQFSDILSRIREAKLNALLDGIDKAGEGGLPGMKQADWRAKAFLVQQVLGRDRYGDTKQQAEQAPAIAISIAPELARLAFPVVDCPSEPIREKLPAPEARALPEARQGDTPQG